MKVFELMNELSKLPSGAEVELRTLMSLEEFAEFHDDGEYREVRLSIEEVQRANDKLIIIYH